MSLSLIAMDISADLMELGRTPVAVVCAGVKSILDIEKTLEVLVIPSFIIMKATHCLFSYQLL